MATKKYIMISIFCSIFFQASFLMAAEPFNLRYYGSFQKMMHMVHMKKVVGVVDLKTALSGHHTYAVGAIKGGRGEITVIDGEVWLAYGRGSLDRVVRTIPGGEEASLVVTAQVRDWREIAVPQKMSEPQLHEFIVDQAERSGLNIKKGFPFLVRGLFQDLKWHVINGLNPKFKGHFMGHGGQPPFAQVRGYRKQASGIVIGFYSADLKGVYTHPGESWHLHVLIPDEKKAGHVDGVVVGKGAIVRLPRT